MKKNKILLNVLMIGIVGLTCFSCASATRSVSSDPVDSNLSTTAEVSLNEELSSEKTKRNLGFSSIEEFLGPNNSADSPSGNQLHNLLHAKVKLKRKKNGQVKLVITGLPDSLQRIGDKDFTPSICPESENICYTADSSKRDGIRVKTTRNKKGLKIVYLIAPKTFNSIIQHKSDIHVPYGKNKTVYKITNATLQERFSEKYRNF